MGFNVVISWQALVGAVAAVTAVSVGLYLRKRRQRGRMRFDEFD